MSPPNTAQRLLSILPAIYREDSFLGQYLWAFEQVLLGLEQKIDDIDTLFYPSADRPEFLPWLSTWMAFTLRADLNPTQQAAFLARVIPLYRRRGTRQNLQELLAIFTRGTPTVTENTAAPPATPQAAAATPLDGDLAHYFHVTVRLQADTPDEHLRLGAIARALIELEKPAHTHYDLDVEFPSMQIGVSSHVGVDTLLGTLPTDA